MHSSMMGTGASERLQEAVIDCLEEVARLARARGQLLRAERLLQAAAFLRADGQPEPAASAELTQREWDVARLVAQGHSNRDIARELIVSDRTVDTHVSHILAKLELSSRAQIAAWVVANTRPPLRLIPVAESHVQSRADGGLSRAYPVARAGTQDQRLLHVRRS